MFKRILVAVDLQQGDMTQRTLNAAAELAEMMVADLRLIHVRFMIERALEYLPDGYFQEEEQMSRAELLDLAATTGIPSQRLSAVSPIGSIFDEVLAAAEDFEADLIVTGPHTPSMAKYLLGGNAARIVRYAKMSVLIVR
jgi:nucleotide-binding universal stress UspA family protein